jgi:hypothetical protein
MPWHSPPADGLLPLRCAANHSVLIALEVQDVEREYARLKGLQLEWVQEKDRAAMEQIKGRRAMAILGAYARLLCALRAWG